jgi:hypothetical protein
MPSRGGSFPDMGREVIKILALALFCSESAACAYPDEGTMPLHRAVTRVKLLPETEAWARAQGSTVQYALFLDRTRQSQGRCYWTVEVRAEGKLWRSFYVTPDGKSVKSK